MATALIGYTGFVGGTLAAQRGWDARFNSKNIEEIRGQSFDVLVCAGAPAEKWKANANPADDSANLARLREALGRCSAERAVLISTVDVYADPLEVDEATPIDPEGLTAYGRHRYELEQFFARQFRTSHVVRLPALVGAGLKKNFLYDLLNDNCLDWTDYRSQFQFYDMRRLADDLDRVMASSLPLVNFATEPVQAAEVAERCYGINFTNQTEKPPARYDMRTRHAEQLGGRGHYLYDRQESLRRISEFVVDERRRVGSA